MVHSEYGVLLHKKRDEFLTSLENIEEIQKAILTGILADNKNTKFGAIRNFKNISSISDFQKAVPVLTYDDYKNFIDEILEGKQNVLTSEKILLLEPTSGSISASKLVPYTKSLKAAFNKGIEPWLSDLYLNFPQILGKPSYWLITPNVQAKQFSSNVKMGFENDLEYLNENFAKIVSENLRPELAPDVEFVSFWNPSLFLILLDQMQLKLDNLKVISCWNEAHAKFYADKLKLLFPSAHIQGKGLLATEGIMTIPLENIGKAPCVNSHFFEFIDTETERIKLLHELELNKNYSILLTTQGGLYRYEIGDIVRVYGFYKNCPLLEFLGKKNNVSDYVGEKINEEHIRQIIEKLDIPCQSLFYLFAPKKEGDDFFYTLYLEPNWQINTEKLEKEFENELLKNFHYQYARNLGQIKPFKISIVKNGARQYLDNCVKKGQKLGDIKPVVFSNRYSWNFNV